jgi:hypothetical protein
MICIYITLMMKKSLKIIKINSKSILKINNAFKSAISSLSLRLTVTSSMSSFQLNHVNASRNWCKLMLIQRLSFLLLHSLLLFILQFDQHIFLMNSLFKWKKKWILMFWRWHSYWTRRLHWIEEQWWVHLFYFSTSLLTLFSCLLLR